MKLLLEGVRKYQREVFPANREHYEKLATGQSPQVLFITCGDSRVDPELITSSVPGEIFVERNPGNLVPRYNSHAKVGVSASVEFALDVLHIRAIVVCGHSDCGAMKAVQSPEVLKKLPAVRRWLVFGAEKQDDDLASLIRRNVLQQMENLKTHPSVRRHLKDGSLTVGGWVYDIGTGNLDVYNESTGQFELLR